MVKRVNNSTDKINVLEEIVKERADIKEYLDENIFSTLYHASLSTCLRALDGYKQDKRGIEEEKNKWLLYQSTKIKDTNVIDFDNVTKCLDNGRASCDIMFYNFSIGKEENKYHFLGEVKNTGKQDMLKLIKSETNNGIYKKVKDSVENIRSCLLFGGLQEGDDIIKNMHLFLVYGGKNNAATFDRLKLPGKMHAEKSPKGKQSSATRRDRNCPINEKAEGEIYDNFTQKIAKLGLKPCYKSTFPGDALPCLKKSGKGAEKIRQFSLFSAADFGQIINSGFFDDWDWGDYVRVEPISHIENIDSLSDK